MSSYFGKMSKEIKTINLFSRPVSSVVKYNGTGAVGLVLMQGRNWARRPPRPPEIIFRGPLKMFFLDGDTKERATKGRC